MDIERNLIINNFSFEMLIILNNQITLTTAPQRL